MLCTHEANSTRLALLTVFMVFYRHTATLKTCTHKTTRQAVHFEESVLLYVHLASIQVVLCMCVCVFFLARLYIFMLPVYYPHPRIQVYNVLGFVDGIKRASEIKARPHRTFYTMYLENHPWVTTKSAHHKGGYKWNV